MIRHEAPGGGGSNKLLCMNNGSGWLTIANLT